MIYKWFPVGAIIWWKLVFDDLKVHTDRRKYFQVQIVFDHFKVRVNNTMVNSSVSALWKAYGWVVKYEVGDEFFSNAMADMVFFFLKAWAVFWRLCWNLQHKQWPGWKTSIIIFTVICWSSSLLYLCLQDYHIHCHYHYDHHHDHHCDPYNDHHHDHLDQDYNQDYHDCRRSSCWAATATNLHRAPLSPRVAPWFTIILMIMMMITMMIRMMMMMIIPMRQIFIRPLCLLVLHYGMDYDDIDEHDIDKCNIDQTW